MTIEISEMQFVQVITWFPRPPYFGMLLRHRKTCPLYKETVVNCFFYDRRRQTQRSTTDLENKAFKQFLAIIIMRYNTLAASV